MTIRFRPVDAAPGDADVLAVLVAEGATDHPGVDWALAGRLGFEGKAGSTQLLAGDGRIVAVVGLGAADAVDTDGVRRAGAVLAKAVRKQAAVAVELGDASGLDPRGTAQALAEGLALASYSYDRFKSEPEPSRPSPGPGTSSTPPVAPSCPPSWPTPRPPWPSARASRPASSAVTRSWPRSWAACSA